MFGLRRRVRIAYEPMLWSAQGDQKIEEKKQAISEPLFLANTTEIFKKDHQNEINETDDVPPPQDTSQSILSQLELVVGKEKLRNSDSAHYQAMKWITEEDPLQGKKPECLKKSDVLKSP